MTINIAKKNLIETLELTFNARYISAKSTERKGGWGVWEGVREFLQNAKDAEDIGNEMWVTYTGGGKKAGGKLHIVNKGVYFGREALVLGGTTKDADPRQRGQFGEGFKLASAVLVDHGCPVTIENGREIWVPRLGKSERFGGAEILLVDVYSNPNPRMQYHVVIENLSRGDYASVRERCLFLDEPKKRSTIAVNDRRILTDPKFIGKLYCRGLFVGAMPEQTAYGYDLPVELDRDRKMAEPWSLKWEIREVLRVAVQRGQIPVRDFMRLLQGNDTIESTVFREFECYGASGDFYQKVAAEFLAENGPDAVPVSEMSESMEAKHHGLKGVVVAPAVRRIVEVVTGKFNDRKTKAASDVRERLAADDLTPEELANLEWALALLDGTVVEDYRVNVVEFVGDKVLGQWSGEGEIRLARRIMADRKQLIATLVHEAAHHGGTDDGSVEHQHAAAFLFAGIIVKLSERS